MENNLDLGVNEPQSILVRKCISCSKQVRGRTDKKFCDDYCRNNYNNRLKAGTNNLVRNINHALGKNRRILENCIQGEERTAKITTVELLQRGFSFKYFTHLFTNKKGSTYFFCYDHGYLPVDNDWNVVVKQSA